MKARRHARFENREASALNEIKFALVLPGMLGGTKTGAGAREKTGNEGKGKPAAAAAAVARGKGEKRKKGKRRPGKGTRLPFPC